MFEKIKVLAAKNTSYAKWFLFLNETTNLVFNKNRSLLVGRTKKIRRGNVKPHNDAALFKAAVESIKETKKSRKGSGLTQDENTGTDM